MIYSRYFSFVFKIQCRTTKQEKIYYYTSTESRIYVDPNAIGWKMIEW